MRLDPFDEYVPQQWFPHGAHRKHGLPEPGWLIARSHAVWRVEAVVPRPVVSDRDQAVWRDAGYPDVDTWDRRPYLVRAFHVGGWNPKNIQPTRAAVLSIPAGWMWLEWHVYPRDRWPMCSCCGEPSPCRADAEDVTVGAAVRKAERFGECMPGCCWACHEPVTSRQTSVRYDGVNLDLPTSLPPQFHTRQACRRLAVAYELRWLAADPDRPRILTYPDCGGWLLCHADGVTECMPFSDGDERLFLSGGRFGEAAPDCGGHLTHDHHAQSACQAAGCPHGCGPGNWIRLPERPPRNGQRALPG